MPKQAIASYIEADCTITHEGKSFTNGGAVVTDQFATGYVGAELNINQGGTAMRVTDGTRSLTDWHGNQIGTCYIQQSWPIRSAYGSRMYQIVAFINGIKYTGRGFGEGMSWNGKRCAKQG